MQTVPQRSLAPTPQKPPPLPKPSAPAAPPTGAIVPHVPLQVPSGPPTPAELTQFAELYERFPWMFPGIDPRDRVTVNQVIDEYLADAKDELDPRTFEYRERELRKFLRDFDGRLVKDCTPFDLKRWMNEQGERLKSGWTRGSVNAGIQRAFNWAVGMRQIRENPFRGIRWTWNKQTGRDMSDAEFQAILRHADPYYRRFLIALKLTGARPGELASLRWEHIDWNRSVAVLAKHKTAKKTGRPRVLVFVPAVLKLLAIIKRDYSKEPPATILRRMLETAPDRTMRAKDVAIRLRAQGFSYRSQYRARQAIGAKYERVGGWREHGYTVYRLPVNVVEAPPALNEHVFLNAKQRPWTRTAISHKLWRLRAELDLPKDCKVYGTRHGYITRGVKRGVNLKALATLVGHQTVAMIERVYCHINGDYEFLQQAAQEVAGLAVPKPLPGDVTTWSEVVKVYPRAVAKPPKVKPLPTGPKPLGTAEQIAFDAYNHAVKKTGITKDGKAFEWLLTCRKFAGQLPPALDTFRRYLYRARLFYHGGGKWKMRRAGIAAKGA